MKRGETDVKTQRKTEVIQLRTAGKGTFDSLTSKTVTGRVLTELPVLPSVVFLFPRADTVVNNSTQSNYQLLQVLFYLHKSEQSKMLNGYIQHGEDRVFMCIPMSHSASPTDPKRI